ncbi:hypothetical protein DFA_11470, partial [Cavenderia fasciculata]
RCDKLPVQCVVHSGDYLEEIILDPLSKLTSDIAIGLNDTLTNNKNEEDLSIYMSPTKKSNTSNNNSPLSPTRPNGGLGVTLQSSSSSPLKSLGSSINQITSSPNNSGSNSNNILSSSLSNDYYCIDCKKGFQSEQTWNTHIGSTKHINQVKENKKKSTSNVSSPTSTSKTTSTTNKKNEEKANKGGKTKQSKDTPDDNNTAAVLSPTSSTFIKKQLELMANVPGKPLLTCKNMFQAAKNYSQFHMINDCSKSLLAILDVLKVQQQKSSSNGIIQPLTKNNNNVGSWNEDFSSIELMLPLDLKIDIWTKIGLETKTYLYLARLTRLFDRKLTETFISKCLSSSSLLDKSLITNIERDGSYRLFIIDPSMVINRLTKIVENSIHSKNQQQQQTNPPPLHPQQEEQKPLYEEYLNMIDEMAGILSFDKCHPLSLFYYYLSISISLSFQLNERVLRTIQRCIRLFVGMDYDYLVSDFYLRYYQLTGQDDLSILCDSLRYSVQANDSNRLNTLLKLYQTNHKNYHLQSYCDKSIEQQTQILILKCCLSVQKSNSLEMEETRDQFEHILSTDRDSLNFFSLCFEKSL